MKINIKVLIQILLVLFIIIFGYFYISDKVNDLIEDRYTKVSLNIKAQLHTLIMQKQNRILELSLAMSENNMIKNALLTNNLTLLHLNKFSKELKKYTDLKNVWFQIVTKNGVSFYRSFSKKRGDNIVKERVDIARIIKNPHIIKSITVGKFTISIKAMVPIYDNGKFIGIFETIAQLNSIANEMQKMNYKTAILIDKSYQKQLVFSDKSKFIDGYYVANYNADKKLLKFIKNIKPDKIVHDIKKYKFYKEINSIVTTYILYDEKTNKPMAYFVMACDINNVDTKDIILVKNNLLLVLGTLLFIIIFIIIYQYMKTKQKIINDMNKLLKNSVQMRTKELNHLAHHDPLTNLANRHLFEKMTTDYIERAKRHKSNLCILFLDLDRFKNINDTYGHSIGDEVLKTTANRLKNCTRSKDFVSRIGGDEFIILLENIDQEYTVNVVTKIIDTIKQPIEIETNKFYITFSIGISCFPKDGDNVETLLSNADMAMYKAKELGRDRYQFYDKEMAEIVSWKIEIEKNIKIALNENQFEPFYQPQIDITSGKIVGAEALIRWDSPNLGQVFPDKFIPIAEETNLIIDIDKWMMRETMRKMVFFEKDGVNTGILSLNISIKQLDSQNFIEDLKYILNTIGFNPNKLELEITEREMMRNPESSIKTLNKIKKLGIKIAIDDFGTGHSSLSYIKRLPIDKIKIDKSFIDNLPENKDNSAIVLSVISIAQHLNMEIIAEGVENKQQRDFLKSKGCKLVQGYLYSKPINADKYKELLSKN